jgi:Flp pilus assembly protein TadG
MRQHHQASNSRRHAVSAEGQALIEMAIVIVLMIMLTVSSVDFGVYMYRYVQAANCVREAARRAVVRADNADNPPYCADAGLKPTLSPANYKAAAPGSEIVASIDINHPWMALDNFIPGLAATVKIKAHTSMRMEGQVVT